MAIAKTNYTVPPVEPLTASSSLDFSSLASQTSEDLTISVPGAAASDVVSLGIPIPTDIDNCFTAFISNVDEVTVRHSNYSLLPIDPVSGIFKVIVFKNI